RRITNVAAGSAATDAVNVSQLMSEDAKVNTVDNNVNSLSNNVSNIAGNVTNISNVVNNITNGGDGIKYFHANSTLADSSATGTDAVAIGGNAQATTTNSVALGSNSVANSTSLTTAGFTPLDGTAISAATAVGGEVSVGSAGAERRITNVAAGLNATDAVNVSQLMSEDAKVSQNTSDITNLSTQVTNINGQMGDAVMYDSSAHDVVTLGGTSGTKIMNLKAGDLSTTSTDAVNGSQLYATNQNVANVSGTVNNIAGDVTNISNVVNNITNGSDGIKYFHANSTLADSSATGTDAVAIGGNAQATAANSIALGSGATTTANLSAAGYNPGSGTLSGMASVTNGEVSVGSAGKERRITNVAAGSAATDAVNVSQLMSEDAKVSQNTSDITNLNTQVTNIDGRVTQNTTDITTLTNNIDNGEVGLVQQDAVSRNITVAKDSDGTVVDFTGTAGTRKLTGLSAGDLSATSTDAVNGSQLYATNQNVANVASNVTNIAGDVTNISNVVNNITNGGDGIKYFHANSTLADSFAMGTDAVAIGGNAQATTANSVALGSNSVANSTTLTTAGFTPLGGTAISAATAAGGEVSVGTAAKERRITNLAAGLNTTDAVNVSQLMSEDAKVNTVNNNVNSLSNNVSNIAGNVTNISNVVNNITNGGDGIKYFHANSTLADSSATGTDAVAIGGNAQATTTNSVALGSNSVANSTTLTTAGFTPLGGTAISAATATGGEVSVGSAGAERRITNVAAGLNATDAVNVSQLMSEDAKVSQNTSDITNLSTQVTNIYGQMGDAVMYDSSAHDVVTLGGTSGTKITNLKAGDLSATSTDAVNGSQLYATNQNVANVIGTVTNISNVVNNITNGGGGIKYFHANSTLADSSATGTEAVAIGGNAQATTANSVALGSGSTTMANLSAAGYNPGSGTLSGMASVTNGEVSVGSADKERRITNVAAGSAATDAVNVSQLMSEDAKVNQNASDITNLSTQVTNINGQMGDAVMYDSSAHDVVTLGGASGTKITNLKAGDLGATSTDAVNGSQLYATNQNVANVTGTVNNIAGDVTNISNVVNNITNGGDGIKYFHANSTLADSSATGTDAVAIGGNAQATTANSVALGSNSVANSTSLTTAGFTPLGGTPISAAMATGGEVSVGSAGKERRITNVAAGSAATDAVNVSQLMSEDAKVNTVNNNVNSLSNNVSNIAGNVTNISNVVNNITNGGGGIKYFHANSTLADSSATATDSLAAGPAAVASATNAVALGNGAKASNAGAVALGAGSMTTTAVATSGTMIGGITYTFAGTAASSTVSVGAAGSERTITNVAAGRVSATSTDAVNGSELYATNQQVTQNSTDITNLTNTVNNGGVGLVKQDATTRNITVAKDTNGTVVDFTGTAGVRKLTGVSAGDVNAKSVDAVSGSQLYALASSTADAMGGGSSVNPDGSVTAPSYVVNGTTVNNVGDAITNLDGRVAQNSTDITNINNTLNNISTGSGVMYFHANSGLADSQATGAESVAIGGNARSQAANSVALGSNSVADRANTVSVGAAGAERQITNVAAGTADTDAVNVAQLKASGVINTDGTTNAAVTYDHNADGSANYNTVTMGNGVAGGTTIRNVAAGSAGDDAVNVSQMNAAISSVKNLAISGGNPMFAADGNRDTEAALASGTHSTAMGANARATGANSVALGANSVADRDNTVSVGSAGNERQIAHVAAGTATTDAVNVGQLNEAIGASVGNLPAGTSAKDYTDQQINAVQNGVNQVARNAYAGIAAATALTMIPDVDQGKTIAVGVGGGSYKGSQAVALGVSARITQNLKMKAGAGTSSQGTTVGVGASYQW
ncbi:hemagglutinin-like protein, partial [Burkholderia sp. Ch1-1]